MPSFVDETFVSIAIGIAILGGLCAIAFYIVSSFRDYNADDGLESDDVLANLREMRLKGDITEEEFRNIQAVNRLTLGTQNETSELPPTGSEETSD